MSQNQRQYIDGVYVREKTGKYGPFLSVGIDIDKLVERAKKLNTCKIINLNFNLRREPSDKGLTHYVTLDTYRKENAGRQFQQAREKVDSQPELPPPDDSDPIPF